MEIIIKSKDITLTEPLKVFIEQKIGSLERLLKNIKPPILIEVEVGRETKHHRKGDVYYAEGQISLPGTILRSSAKKDDLRLAIVEVKDDLQRQIKKYKNKNP